MARSLWRFNEPGVLSASAGGAVDALPGTVYRELDQRESLQPSALITGP